MNLKRFLGLKPTRPTGSAERVSPRRLRLEASSFCQLRCPSCPTTDGSIHPAVGSGFLRFEDFERLVDLNPSVRRIELSNYGEIFLNPQLSRILEYAHRKGISIALENGVNLNNVKDEALEALVLYGVEIVTCSIDGASPETYRTYRVRGNFDTVLRNVGKINEFKRKHGSALPHLVWQFVVFGHNEHELPAAREMAAGLDMEFRTKLSWDGGFSPIRDRAFVRAQIGLPAVTREEYERETGEKYASAICHQLWDDPQINWDGKVLGCGRNFWGDFGGNAFRDGLIESLNNDKIAYARDMLRGRVPPREDIPCTTCEMYVAMRERSHFIERPGAVEKPAAFSIGRDLDHVARRVTHSLIEKVDAELLRAGAAVGTSDIGAARVTQWMTAPPFLTGRAADSKGGAPLVSILLPTRDRADHIGDAIRSVQAQSWTNWELIIVDDGSLDETRQAVAGFLGDRRIRYVSAERSGQSAARNTALAQASGSLVACLDSDNLWFPHFLEAAIGAFALFEEADLAYGALVTDAHADVPCGILFREFDRDELLRGNYIDLNCVVFRRALAATHGGFDETLTRLVDWDVLLRYTQVKPAIRIPVLAAQYRVVDDRRVTDTQAYEANFDAVQKKWRQ